MRFRLTYEGRLEASSNSSGKVDNKQEIRRQIHPQLRRLWDVDPRLTDWRVPDEENPRKPPEHWPKMSELLAKDHVRDGFRYVPLVSDKLRLRATLDVIFLRTALPGGVIRSGDIDGRLKTLFDGLRMPLSAAELGSKDTPLKGEDPFFVLLEDDKLVTRVSVDADTLLQPTPTAEGAFLDNDAPLLITVSIAPCEVWMNNLRFV